MPFSYAQYTGNGSTTTFSVPFPYILKTHVALYTGYDLLNSTFTSQLTEGTDYTWSSDTQVQTTAAVPSGVVLTILRTTPGGSLLVPWQDGSNLIADDLVTSDLQNLFVVQESTDRSQVAVDAAIEAASTAEAALAAVSSQLQFELVADVAAIPTAPENGTYVEVINSTGIESFTPLTGMPAGFVGDSGLSVRMGYTTASAAWAWLSYAPTNADARYLKQTTAAQVYLTQTAAAAAYQPLDPETAKTDVVQAFTAAQRGAVVTLTPAASVAPNFAAGNNFALALDQNTTLANPTNVAPGQSGVITITQDATARTLAYGSFWCFEGGVPTLGTTPGAVSCLVYYVDSPTRITAKLISEPTNP